MRPVLIALCTVLACLCACQSAEACPLGQRVGRAAKAPLKVLKAKPARRVVGWVLGR